MRTVEGFDPFQDGWEAFEKGGIEAVNAIEAPLMMYVAEPDLATEVAKRFAAAGLQAVDLRFGVWPDAAPVQSRTEDEPVGIHLNVFGRRQIRLSLATPVEKAALGEFADQMEEHIREVIDPEFGVSQSRFGKLPTMHEHVAARERAEDATENWLAAKRAFVPLERRQEMRDRVSLDLIPGRREAIARKLTQTIEIFAA